MVSKLKLFSFFFFSLFYVSNFNAQIADFTPSQLSGCSPITVTFTNNTVGATSYSWDFDNSNTSSLTNPVESFITAKTYNVKLTAFPSGNTKTISITVFKNPVANFSASDTTGCFPLAVTFTDLSVQGSGALNSHTWDFGDAGTAFTTNPTHTYSSAGTRTVTLIVKDVNGCQSTKTKSAYIKILNSNLVAGFTASPALGCKAPATVVFTNTSSGTGVLTYSWDFGDTQTSVATSPPHTYNSSGTYTVTMKVINSNGCSKTAVSTYTVLGTVTPNFSFAPDSICPGDSFKFTDNTVPVPTSWLWNFNDLGSSVIQSPYHPYAAAGTYNVKLKVGYAGVCFDSVTKPVKVNPKPSIAFSGDTVVHCKVPFTVDFTDASLNASQWIWNFGDPSSGAANTSASNNPSHTYNAAGVYTVKLKVISPGGCVDSLIKVNYVIIQPPVAVFTPNPDRGCVPLTSAFINSSTSLQTVSVYSWDFNDGNTITGSSPVHTFSVTGTFNVKLTFTNAYGCTANTTVPVYVTVPPIMSFTVNPNSSCALTPVQFTDNSVVSTSWLWNFGDPLSGGSNTSSLKNPQHNFADTGYFKITLIAKNIGCPDTLIIDSMVHVSPAVPRFVTNFSCSNVLNRLFTSSSIGADSLIWDFGDLSPKNADISANNSSVNHIYAPGTYTVHLTAKNLSSGCRRDTSQVITVIDLQPKYTVTPSVGCAPLNVKFTDQSTGGTIISWNWRFGDGFSTSSATIKDTAHTYNGMGKKTVRLYITDQFGCVDSLVKVDTVNVLTIAPDLTIASKVGCDSLGVTFNDISVVIPGATGWNIKFGDLDSSVASPSYLHYYLNSGTYSVTYSVTNPEGTCTTTKTNFVTFNKTTAAFSASTVLTCPGSNINFTNTSVNSDSWIWDFGDGTGTVTTQAPSHSYSANGVYPVTLIATNTVTGCSNTLTKPAYITIDKPSVGFTTSSTAANCPPFSVTFIDTSKSVSSITNYDWDFGDGGIGLNNDTAVHIYTTPGTYDVKLIITNTAGCKDSITKIGLIVVNGPNGTFTIVPDSGCVPLLVNFNAVVTPNTKKFIWTFGDGNPGNDTCCQSHNYTTSGIFTPILVLEDFAGCQYAVPSVATVKVNSYPFPNFTYTPAYPKAAELVQFTDLSLVGVSWAWNFGDGIGTSTNMNPTYAYSASGVYIIKMIVNNAGCVDSITKKITVVEDLVIPNIFTPNGDGKNDTFVASAYGITSVDIHIFDRWGVEIFKKVSPKIFWDGHTNSGQAVTDGTYYYIISATTIGGEVLIYKGFVQLVR